MSEKKKSVVNLSRYELSPGELREFCDPSQFDFKTTAELEPLSDVIGQERAVQAIRFGLEMKSHGYNIFVTGLPGTGKSTIVRDLVSEYARQQTTPSDWCMVNNFHDEYRPRALPLPPGRGVVFARAMDRFIEDLKKELNRIFNSRGYEEKLAEIQSEISEKKRRIFMEIEQLASKHNIQISETPTGFKTIPIREGKPISREEYLKLPQKLREKIEQDIKQVQDAIESGLMKINKLNQEQNNRVDILSQETAEFVIKNRIAILREEFRDCREVLDYLREVQEDIIEHVGDFLEKDDGEGELSGMLMQQDHLSFKRYRVNVLVDRKGEVGAPVIFETNPTYANVFGKIEKRSYMGAITTDFTMVQSGSLLRANGGYLIMEVESVLMNPFVWEALKRSLQNRILQIEDMGVELGYVTSALRPEPIPLNVKVILLGSYEIFHALQNLDNRFNKIFKVRADFDYEVPRTEDTIQNYVRFISRVCKEEGLLPFTPRGVSAIIEYGEKQIANKNKLSLRFGTMVGILREADYWARKMRSTRVTDKHVIKAFTEYRFRYNLYEEKIHEAYLDDSILIDVEGEKIGQVNALSVFQIGEFSFGRPIRITAETYMGKHGIINIEREAKLSGKTHDKGVLILSGYLGRTFAQNFPLNVSISITFEQSYSGVDGDSASSTELYAILSSLSGFPIKQGIAVTGSVNQKGEIQAVGGINQKIEGFFEVCKAKGLTGEQGVIIPRANVKNLMLKKEVVDAVRKGQFHIYAIDVVQEGIEILTGVPAGKMRKDFTYPPGTVYGEAQKRLEEYLKKGLKLRKEFLQEEENSKE